MLLAKLGFALVAALLVPLTVVATTYLVAYPVKTKGSAPLFRLKRAGKWGFINRGGKIVIPPQFDEVGEFFQGRARVRVGERWGYVDPTGKFLMPPLYHSATDFQQDRAIVTVGNAAGVIDSTGHWVVRPRYTEIRPYSDNRAAIWIGAKEKALGEDAVWRYGGPVGIHRS